MELVYSVIISVWIHNVHAQTKCQAPAVCTTVDNCPLLSSILENDFRTKDQINLLRESICGYSGTTPKVCCNDASCKTPEGTTGKCIGVYSCPHIVNMLKLKPIPQKTMDFVQKSRCDGPEQYSICCGKQPVSTPEPPPAVPGECKSTALPLNPSTKCCGRDVHSGDRIIGGTATGIDEYPWLAVIEYKTGDKIYLLCGGTLISGRYVLTAGHCVKGVVLNYGTPINVRLGEYDTSNNGKDCVIQEGGDKDCTDEPVVIPIEEIIHHPLYRPNEHRLKRNDIALIRLKELAPYTEFIRPICLPATDVTIEPPEYLNFYAAGWGAINATVSSSKVKLHVDLPYKNQKECQEAYNVPRRSTVLWDKQLCAGGEKGKDSCKGDSGGPLMYENEGVFQIVGVVSFGPNPCGLEDVPGVYTKVYEYDNWIRSEMEP